jgi:AcrR family transcriptional regulator
MARYRQPIAARRDPEETRARILDALSRIILRVGLSGVGINALAREAECDKVLIYRYFGDLDGVYKEFASSREFWWTVEDLTHDIERSCISGPEAMKLFLRRHTEAIRSRPVTLAVLAEEAAARTPLVIALEAVREKRALALEEWIGKNLAFPSGIDFPAIALILSTATTYLAVRARKIRVMSGVLIKLDEDWKRIYAALDALIDGLGGVPPPLAGAG